MKRFIGRSSRSGWSRAPPMYGFGSIGGSSSAAWPAASGCNDSRLGRVCVFEGERYDALSDHDDLPMCGARDLTVAGPTPAGFGVGFCRRQ
jgi:hypothetical protein